MKKVSLLLAAFALVMGLSQCRKPNLPVLNAGETQHVVLNASWDNGGSKLDQEGTGLKWKENDKLYVDKVGGTSIGTLICKDPDNGTFEGYIIETTGNITFTFRGANYKENFMEQTGNLDDAVLLKSEELEYKSDGNYGTVSMKMPHAVLKLDLSALGKAEGTTVTIKVVGGGTVASVKNVKNDEASKALYVAVPASPAGSSETKIYEFESSAGTARCADGWALVNNTFYTLTGGTGAAIVVTPSSPELLPGKFSVSATEYVQFSRGNLFCTRNGSEGSYTYEFGLEQHQYDFRTRPGYASVINGVYAVNGTGANMSGHFYWDIAKAQAGKDYGAFSTTAPTGGTTSDILDWGPALDAASHWTTLSRTEWNYLISTREVKSKTGLGYTCQFVYFKGVDGLDTGVDGLIIYPDGYDGEMFTNQQEITVIPTGCVFIPMAGKFFSDAVENVNKRCNYWTSSHGPEGGNAYQFLAYGTTCHANNTPGRANGLSVRLVQRFPKPEIEPTFVDLGLPSGTLWANVNVGATALTGPGSYGKYYSFGETAAYLEPMTGYGSWTGSTNPNYVVGDIKQYTSDTYWKWKDTGKYKSGDIMLAEDDIATQKYGEGCHIPTLEQWKELFNTTYCSWTNVEGGVKVTSNTYTDRSIFIPKSGYYNSSSNYNTQTRFWSSDYWDSYSQNSVYINSATSMSGSGLSEYGQALTIRSVKKPATAE